MIRRKIRLKITTHSRESVNVVNQPFDARCPSCDHQVEMVTETVATGILGIDSVTFGRLVDAGLVHTIQTVLGDFRVCKDSLFSIKE